MQRQLSLYYSTASELTTCGGIEICLLLLFTATFNVTAKYVFFLDLQNERFGLFLLDVVSRLPIHQVTKR